MSEILTTKEELLNKLCAYADNPDDDNIRYKEKIHDALLNNAELLYALNNEELESELFDGDKLHINKETGELEKPDADLEHAAQRELREETCINLPVEKFEQIKTYSHMFDPRLRIVDTAFAVKVPTKMIKNILN